MEKIFDFSKKMTAEQFEKNLNETNTMNELKELIYEKVKDIFFNDEYLVEDDYDTETFKLTDEEIKYKDLYILISGKAWQNCEHHNSFDEPPHSECSNQNGYFTIKVYKSYEEDPIAIYSYEYPENELTEENESID